MNSHVLVYSLLAHSMQCCECQQRELGTQCGLKRSQILLGYTLVDSWNKKVKQDPNVDTAICNAGVTSNVLTVSFKFVLLVPQAQFSTKPLRLQTYWNRDSQQPWEDGK